MPDSSENLSVALFSEMFMADQLARTALSKVLPKVLRPLQLKEEKLLQKVTNSIELV